MHLRNISIKAQLAIGYALVIIFVIILGVVSYTQTNRLYQQTETLYRHPLQVRTAIGNLNVDIVQIRAGLTDLVITDSEQDRQSIIENIRTWDVDALKQLDKIDSLYLGPREDIIAAQAAYNSWMNTYDDNLQLILADDTEHMAQHLKSDSALYVKTTVLMDRIAVLDDYATNKSDSVYADYVNSHNALAQQRIALLLVIVFFSLAISFLVNRNIHIPMDELTRVSQRFYQGDMSARSTYDNKNEFGALSGSFNAMFEMIQKNTLLKENAAGLADIMLRQEDADTFFRRTLDALASKTGAQTAAVYLLSNDKKSYVHFASIGLDEKARQSFSAHEMEGELGLALSTQKLQYIDCISEQTRFIFPAVGGSYIPHEIITIPILAENEVIALISLSSLGHFLPESLELLDFITDMLSARIEGILAFRTITEFSGRLEIQNRELDAQKTQLLAQSSELSQQNTEIEMQRDQLAEANQMKTNFLSNMSHELRTPLNSVIALSGVLYRRLSGKIPEEEHEYLEVIERNGKLLLSLINDILDLSRIEAGREEVEITAFNLSALISDVVALIDPQAKQKKLKLDYLPGEGEISVSCDADKLRHILQNIIANAVKFTEKGKVEVFSKRNGDYFQITVADTGIGIDPAHLPHIFDEFRQADGSTSRRYGGSGLGLAIAKKYTELLGGVISVTSIPDRGSVFTVSIPLHYTGQIQTDEQNTQAGFAPVPRPSPSAALVENSAKTVLIVEDSEPAIVQLTDLLSGAGYRLLIARDAEEAFVLIAQDVPDAIILDLMMPRTDGFEVLRQIRDNEKTAYVPVLILTAKHITKSELNFLRKNNVHQLIQKGDVNRAQLLDAVADMLSPPLIKANEAPPVRKSGAAKETPAILVVEDNADNMITIKALLAKAYRVIQAEDGLSAVSLAKKHLPDLILMDISLPGQDGIAAFKNIRGAPESQHIPVIALTASAMVQDRETILSYGFDAYISKPIIEQEFFSIISEVLYGS